VYQKISAYSRTALKKSQSRLQLSCGQSLRKGPDRTTFEETHVSTQDSETENGTEGSAATSAMEMHQDVRLRYGISVVFLASGFRIILIEAMIPSMKSKRQYRVLAGSAAQTM
jgi:hypothetical protein